MKNIFLLIMVFGIHFVHGQILKPVEWSTSVEKITDSEYQLIATATIDSGWHLYSQNVPENGPIPTRFVFQGNPNYLKKGNTTEDEGHTVNDPVFEMKITYFEKKAHFKQRIKVKGNSPFKVNGTVEFMVCDDKRCLPPTEVDLEFRIE